jgi:hypothetical protein
MLRDVYFGRVELHGEEHENTLRAASNYASSLIYLNRFDEVKSLLLKTLPVTQRVFGDSNEITLRMRWTNAMALYMDDGAAAVEILEEIAQTARRVFGSANPLTEGVELNLREMRAMRARDLGGA